MMQLENVISRFETVIDFAKRNGNTSGFVFVDDLQAAVDYIKQQIPKIMTYDEVKEIAKSNLDAYIDETKLVWLEEMQQDCCNIVRTYYSYHPEWGDNEYQDSVTAVFIGSDYNERYFQKEYGKTWRCWTKRPTEEQREATLWEN